MTTFAFGLSTCSVVVLSMSTSSSRRGCGEVERPLDMVACVMQSLETVASAFKFAGVTVST